MGAQSPHPLTGVEPEGLVLLVPVAQPDAEDEAPAGDDVERGGLLGHRHRIEQRQQVNRDPDPHRAGLRGKPGRRHGRLGRLVLVQEEVLAEHQHVEPQIAGQANLLDGVGKSLDHR